jgi:hypothetical protein
MLDHAPHNPRSARSGQQPRGQGIGDKDGQGRRRLIAIMEGPVRGLFYFGQGYALNGESAKRSMPSPAAGTCQSHRGGVDRNAARTVGLIELAGRRHREERQPRCKSQPVVRLIAFGIGRAWGLRAPDRRRAGHHPERNSFRTIKNVQPSPEGQTSVLIPNCGRAAKRCPRAALFRTGPLPGHGPGSPRRRCSCIQLGPEGEQKEVVS